MVTFASPTSASKRSELHQRAHRRCFHLRQRRAGGVGLSQPMWFKQHCEVHSIKVQTHKAVECTSASNKMLSHFVSYMVSRRFLSLYARTSVVIFTWLCNSLGLEPTLFHNHWLNLICTSGAKMTTRNQKKERGLVAATFFWQNMIIIHELSAVL